MHEHIPGRLRAGAVHRNNLGLQFSGSKGGEDPLEACLFVNETHKHSRKDAGDKAGQLILQNLSHGKILLQRVAMAVLFVSFYVPSETVCRMMLLLLLFSVLQVASDSGIMFGQRFAEIMFSAVRNGDKIDKPVFFRNNGSFHG